MGNDDLVNDYLNILGEEGYISLINSPTRIQGNTQSCLDHIFLKTKKYACNNTEIIPIIVETHITDHYSTIAQIVIPEKKENTKKEYYRSYINKEQLLDSIQN